MTSGAQHTRTEVSYASFADLVHATCEKTADLETIRQAFIKRFGPIIISRFGNRLACGVALTDLKVPDHGPIAFHSRPERSGDRRRRLPRLESRWLRQERRWRLSEQRRPVRLHLFLPTLQPTTVQALQSLSKCQQQAVYARRFLEDEDLRQCLTLLYWPADALIAIADSEAATPDLEVSFDNAAKSPKPAEVAATEDASRNDTTDRLIDVINEQLDAAEEYYQNFTQRTVRSAYFRGLGYGMVALTALFVVLYIFRRPLSAPTALLWSIVAGALGALTSVLSSATFGRIVLDRPQGGTWNTYLGAFRPLIGSLFGVAFFALIDAGFLPIKVPSGSGMIALYSSVAFLAGFSHRWAQDTLKAAQGRVSTPPIPSAGTEEKATTTKPVHHNT
jgi:hypothetical protein